MSSSKVSSLYLLFYLPLLLQIILNFGESFNRTMLLSIVCLFQECLDCFLGFVDLNQFSFFIPFLREFQIIQLFSGETTTGNGDTLASLRELSDEDLESRHDYIQYMFPSEEASQFNSVAPTVTPDVIEEFRQREDLRNELVLNFQRILTFWDFSMTGELIDFLLFCIITCFFMCSTLIIHLLIYYFIHTFRTQRWKSDSMAET